MNIHMLYSSHKIKGGSMHVAGVNIDGLDLYDLLEHIARECKVESYLEVGSWKGDSLRAVRRGGYLDAVTLVDDWSYPDSNKHLVIAACYGLEYQILDGNSHKVLPRYFVEFPNEMYDLTLVDGDHTAEGALQDLQIVWPHSRILVFHDICHPAHPYLADVFDTFYASVQTEVTAVHKSTAGYGAGVLVR